MNSKMEYPTPVSIESANRFTLCKWHRFLPTPNGNNETALINRIHELYTAAGGFNSQISKKLGFDKDNIGGQ